ncbi:MAG: M48 family metallopeptidase [Limisphaerales bacterium]
MLGPPPPHIQIGKISLPVTWRRNLKARRYILRLKRPACLVATIPRGGSQREAWSFIERSKPWIQQQLAKPIPEQQTEIWFRGVKIPIADFDITFVRQLAEAELTRRVLALAAQTHSEISRITVRNQRTRWGSCSRRRAISLNWRLIQTPAFVVDYIILHELMHLRQMNHSQRFWDEVEKVCPTWREAEKWLRHHGREIMS